MEINLSAKNRRKKEKEIKLSALKASWSQKLVRRKYRFLVKTDKTF